MLLAAAAAVAAAGGVPGAGRLVGVLPSSVTASVAPAAASAAATGMSNWADAAGGGGAAPSQLACVGVAAAAAPGTAGGAAAVAVPGSTAAGLVLSAWLEGAGMLSRGIDDWRSTSLLGETWVGADSGAAGAVGIRGLPVAPVRGSACNCAHMHPFFFVLHALTHSCIVHTCLFAHAMWPEGMRAMRRRRRCKGTHTRRLEADDHKAQKKVLRGQKAAMHEDNAAACAVRQGHPASLCRFNLILDDSQKPSFSKMMSNLLCQPHPHPQHQRSHNCRSQRQGRIPSHSCRNRIRRHSSRQMLSQQSYRCGFPTWSVGAPKLLHRACKSTTLRTQSVVLITGHTRFHVLCECMCVQVYACMRARVYVFACACMHACACACVCVCMCVSARVSACAHPEH